MVDALYAAPAWWFWAFYVGFGVVGFVLGRHRIWLAVIVLAIFAFGLIEAIHYAPPPGTFVSDTPNLATQLVPLLLGAGLVVAGVALGIRGRRRAV